MVARRLSIRLIQRMKEEAAMPPLAATTLELSDLKTPIRDRLKIPIPVPQPSALPCLLICLSNHLKYQ